MPHKPPHPCAHAGCPGLTRTRYCPAHAVDEQHNRTDSGYDQQRGSATRRGYGPGWRKTRLAHLRAEPLCRRCAEVGLTEPAVDVDHINGDPTDNRPENHQSLCHSCHSRKTAKENGGFGSNKIS